MNIAIILPHTLRFGGVRRFIDIGNEFVNRGHTCTIYAGAINKAHYWNFNGTFKQWDEEIKSDIILCGDTSNPKSFIRLENATGHKFIYVIASAKNYISRYKSMRDKADFILNNRKFTELGEPFETAWIVEGGINDTWKPNKIRVGYHGKKGGEIENQLTDLNHIELIPLKGLDDEELLEVYRKLDYFISWEGAGGWANMAAEALACGCPVVTNGFNCEAFKDKCTVVDNLKQFFENPMKGLRYSDVARKLIEIFNTKLDEIKFPKYQKKGGYHWNTLATGKKSYVQHIDNIKEMIIEKNILDVGCGDGVITKAINATGVEQDEIAVGVAVSHGLKVTQGTAYELSNFFGDHNAVLMADVIEHLRRPGDALREVEKVSNTLYITTPDREPKKLGFAHCQEWNMKEFIDFMSDHGWETKLCFVNLKTIYGKFKKNTEEGIRICP